MAEANLIKCRATVKSSLTRIQNYIRNASEPQDINQLKCRNDKLEEIWSNYNNTQSKLEELDDEHCLDREQFEVQYYDTKSEILREINTMSEQPVSHREQVHNRVNLPKLNIPQFNGDFQNWRSFIDLFMSIIHRNTNISNIEKFYYLKSCLKGEALKVIDAVTTSAENYNTAFQLLVDRYDNKQYIVNAHLRSLFNLPPITKHSDTGLRALVTDTKQQIESLRALEVPIEHWDIILIYLISQKLDSASRREWEFKKLQKEFPTLRQFYEFLESRCMSLEAISPNESINKLKTKVVAHTTSSLSSKQAHLLCHLCQGQHRLYACEKFHALGINDRIKAVKTAKTCFNCLNPGHGVTDCRASGCKKCGKKHSTFIHLDRDQQKLDTDLPSKSEISNHHSVTLHSCESKPILLSTATIKIKNSQGFWIECRVLLDSASQSNFISKRMIEKLKLKVFTSKLDINGISGTSAQVTHHADILIRSRLNDYKRKLRCLVLEKITNELPHSFINIDNWKLPVQAKLADPLFHQPAEIDLLIGAEIYLSMLKNGQIKLGPQLPVLQNTVFGWIISGIVASASYESNLHSYFVSTELSTNELVQRFWEIENVPPRAVKTKEEEECEEHFKSTTWRDKNGRYVVKLPLRSKSMKELGDSYEVAKRRFGFLERKLKQNPVLRNEYQNFLKEYLELGHMEIVHRNQQKENRNQVYYIPHHAVVKETSTTTKVRVVFDASMKSSTGISLNDMLKVGPVVQQDLLSIVLRFRLYTYAFTADVEKMYRQIKVDTCHTDLQRILWRNSSEDDINIYRLTTVTYGTSSAPYLAIRCLQQLAFDEGDSYPQAKIKVLEDFYVDDVMTGENNLQQALELQTQLIALLKRGGFNLRKWSSNNHMMLENLDPEMRETSLPLVVGKNAVKTLGLLWLPAEDQFKFVINLNEEQNQLPITKRKILSDVAKIFDPLGLLAPVVVRAKLFLQQLWKEKLDWDSELKSSIVHEWLEFRQQLQQLSDFSIERRVVNVDTDCILSYELHGFCDASQLAYGACIYLKSSNQKMETSVHLIAAKSRVAPLKQLTIPRLELCGALILARLVDKVIKSLQLSGICAHLWTDSTITLNWIASESSRWKIFVAHRVAEIQELTQGYTWHHVSTKDNPADNLSRGRTTLELKHDNTWWHGPNWLLLSENDWPRTLASNQQEETAELKTQSVTAYVCTDRFNLFNKFSSFTRLQRVTAYCIRFTKNARQPHSKSTGILTSQDLRESLHTLIKRVQLEEFYNELQDLSRNITIKRCHLRSLNPFIDNEGIMRVGGRLHNSNISYQQMHPIILPKHEFTNLLLRYEHHRLLHAGTQAVLGSIREHYWILQARSSIKKIIHGCIICHRFKAQQCQQLMGSLPSYRVQPSRAFTNTGIDYTGPVYIKTSLRKNAPMAKAYVALFVCLATRAIHLELVSSLSTAAFLAAFKRFISRRGKCATIYSDNATNFRGANKEMRELYNLFQKQHDREHIINQAATLGVDWKFIPPKAPHFGGIWEAGIKTVKHHLRRVVGNHKYTFEEYVTLLTQIEACVNSRPLNHLSDDPTDYTVLTPGHFLTGGPLTAMPEPCWADLPHSRLTRWQFIQKQVEFFWKRWSQDYLNTLQQRSKWSTQQRNIKVGSLVLLRDDHLLPLEWCLGRVKEVHPGQDGLVRVVTITTANGTFQRPITKICRLPLPEESTF